jgi:hypothetical protein
MPTGRCLYLVSSSSSREYVADCLEALALPRGVIHHFRYLTKYVDESLRSLLPKSPGGLPSKLQDLSVVVVYLYQEQTGGAWKPAGTLNDEGRYLPVRCGRLVDAFREGDVAHFYFEITDYVVPTRRRVSARRLLNSKVKFRLARSRNAKPSYAHLGPDLKLGARRSEDALAFQRFVDLAYKPSEWRTRSLGSAPLDVTYDVVFVRIGGVFREHDNRLIAVKPTYRPLVGNPVAEYELTVGVTYHLQVATRMATRLPAELPGQGSAVLRLKFDPRVLTPAGPTSLRLSSTYDLEYWAVRVARSKMQRSLLLISCKHDLPVDTENFLRRELLCPEIVLPVSVVLPTSPRHSRRQPATGSA